LAPWSVVEQRAAPVLPAQAAILPPTASPIAAVPPVAQVTVAPTTRASYGEAIGAAPALSAPLPLDELLPVLAAAGMQLAQTDPARLAASRQRIDADRKPARIPRQRVRLPPLDSDPLVQVETRAAKPVSQDG
jgi:ribonuclease E